MLAKKLSCLVCSRTETLRFVVELTSWLDLFVTAEAILDERNARHFYINGLFFNKNDYETLFR
jgi:hypothetical protein